jgi:hypothetical protein
MAIGSKIKIVILLPGIDYFVINFVLLPSITSSAVALKDTCLQSKIPGIIATSANCQLPSNVSINGGIS